MKSTRWPTKLLSCVLIVAILGSVIPYRSARAELVATEAVVAPTSTPEQDRARLRALLDRKDVQAQLQAYGVSAEEAAARVDALTNSEVALVVKRLDELPAGGHPIILLFVLVAYGVVYAALGAALLIGFVVAAAVRAATRGRGPAASKPSGLPADLKWPPIDASYVMSVRTSGSYGSASQLQTIRFLGERPWQSEPAFAFSDGPVTTYVDPRHRLLARVGNDNGAFIESYAPYFVFADWPLAVGTSWPNRYRYFDDTLRLHFDDLPYDGQVEAYEDVATAAGTFKAFKIALRGTSSDLVLWYSNDLGRVVKVRAERFSDHYLGGGVHESDLLSYDVPGIDTTVPDPARRVQP